MSSFLLLNGIDTPCGLAGGAKVTSEDIGTSKRAIDGTMLIHRRVTKLKWALQLTPQDDLHARAFRDLVLGRGHFFSYDATVYSKKGLGPSLLTGTIWAAGGGYLGTGRLAQSAGATNKVQITLSDIVTSKRWTAMYARQLGAGGFTHYVATFDGSAVTSWVNGSVGSAQSWLTVSTTTGVVELDADAGSVTNLCDLVLMPFQIPTDWPAQMYALNNGGTRWSDLARLNATGTGVEGNARTLTVQGMAGELADVPSTLAGGSFAENNQTFTFQLAEV